ncbi:hypothetical protein PanWU01x14_338070 [Parasponia andersonii]|uniref:Uncharacterized protein n=1 Tax=Parasponia andersonii TaxID=3476 RepID=A0A2P5AFA2_PARAD|nr:hypothetical protein PanWU01x14_338070 [Parasponia andersonii]
MDGEHKVVELHDSVLVKFKGRLIMINKHGTELGWSSCNVTLNSKLDRLSMTEKGNYTENQFGLEILYGHRDRKGNIQED